MRLKESKKPVQPDCLKVAVLDVTNDEIVATWLKMPSNVMECPIFSCCATCRKCWK